MTEVELPDGTILEFPDGMSQNDMRAATQKYLQKQAAPQQADPRNPDGTYGQVPEGMVRNPGTGQYTSQELLQGNEDVGRGEAVALGTMQGLGFGAGDETVGALNAAFGSEGTAQERYDFGRELMRAKEGSARENHPYATGISEAAGAIGTGLTYGLPAIASRGLGGAMLGGAGVGAAEGLTYGYLSGEGGAGPRAANAAQYGFLGGALGGAAPVATSLAVRGGQAAKDVALGGFDALTGTPRATRANRAIARTLQQSGRSVDDVDAALRQAAEEGQPEYRAADALGISGQRRLSSVARSGGDGSTQTREFLEARQAGQPERVAGAVEDAFDLRGSTARAARETLEQGRKADADIAFGGIRAQGEPVDIRPVLAEIDSSLTPFREANIQSPLRRSLERLRRQLAGQSGDASYELSDFSKVFAIRRELRDQISEAYRSGKSELGTQLRGVRDAMDQAMAASSDEYASAMDRYSRSSRVIDAVETGERMGRPGSRATDNATDFARMTPDEQAAARTGYGDRALTRVESAAGGGNRARPLTSPKAQADAQTMAVDPNLLGRRVGREMDMYETRNIALGGSRTADNQADIAELAGYDLSAMGNLAAGRFGAAAGQIAGQFQDVLTGMNDSTRNLITDAMLAGDTKALRQAMRQIESTEARRQVANIAIRAGILRNTDPEAAPFKTN